MTRGRLAALLVAATAAAAAALSVAGTAHAESPPTPGPRVKVSVLRLRSLSANPDDLAALSAQLTEALASAEGIEVLDPVAALVEKGANDWLRADKLLYDGMQDYAALRLEEAIAKLREAAELGQASFRADGDAQGSRRIREACFYLGLAHLELGEMREAEEWLGRAVLAEPTFVPDPRSYPPAARTKYAEVREAASGPAYETARDMLEPMAARIGADVLVTGGVGRTPQGTDVLEIVIADRWKGRLAVESIPATGSSRERFSAALAAATPRLVAQVLDRPWGTAATRRPRARASVGYAMHVYDRLALDGRVGSQSFRYRGNVVLHGVALSLTPWQRGALSVETDLAFFAPRALARGGFRKPSLAEGRVLFAGAAAVRGVGTLRAGRWAFAGGAGLAVNEIVAGLAAPDFAAPDNQLGIETFWPAPLVTASVRRELWSSAHLKLDVAAEYDAFTGPARGSVRTALSGGMSF